MTSDVSEFLTERHRVFTNAGIMRRQIFVFIVILGTEAQGRKPAAFHSDKV
jgi:hypothetical protein